MWRRYACGRTGLRVEPNSNENTFACFVQIFAPLPPACSLAEITFQPGREPQNRALAGNGAGVSCLLRLSGTLAGSGTSSIQLGVWPVRSIHRSWDSDHVPAAASATGHAWIPCDGALRRCSFAGFALAVHHWYRQSLLFIFRLRLGGRSLSLGIVGNRHDRNRLTVAALDGESILPASNSPGDKCLER